MRHSFSIWAYFLSASDKCARTKCNRLSFRIMLLHDDTSYAEATCVYAHNCRLLELVEGQDNPNYRQVLQNLFHLLLKDFWCDLLISKGNLWMQYLPKSVMKVVYVALLTSNGICQKPADTSSLVKTFEPESWCKILPLHGCIETFQIDANPDLAIFLDH